jgi:hypothetical protein
MPPFLRLTATRGRMKRAHAILSTAHVILSVSEVPTLNLLDERITAFVFPKRRDCPLRSQRQSESLFDHPARMALKPRNPTICPRSALA